MLTRQAPRPLRLLVAMPALNEEQTVGQVVQGVPRKIDGVGTVDVLVINDGSTDATLERARDAGAIIISHSRPMGVGAAFQRALHHAIEHGYDLLATLDADGQFTPSDVATLVEPIVTGRADFVSASRFADPALEPEMPQVKRWGNRMMSRLISRLARQRFHDVSCGMRCYNREAMVSLNVIGAFTYTQEVFLNLAFKGFRLVEVPIAVRGVREYGKSRVASNLVRYAMQTSKIIFRCYRDYRPMRLFGRAAFLLAAVGGALGAFLLVHYAMTGSFSPHKWAGFTAGALLVLAMLCAQTGMIGDMLDWHRIYLEQLLYMHRKTQTRSPDAPPAAEQPAPDATVTRRNDGS